MIIISVKDYSSVLSVGQGELFSLIASALFALSYVSRKWQTNFLSNKEIAQILFISRNNYYIFGFRFDGESLPRINLDFILIVSLVSTGFFNAINIFLINYGFKNVKAVLASSILTLEAVFAVILAIIFYKEFPSVKELFGGALIIGSVIQMNRLKD